jgi:hypothetical protein
MNWSSLVMISGLASLDVAFGKGFGLSEEPGLNGYADFMMHITIPEKGIAVKYSDCYTNGTYYNVPLTGGSGTSATATVVVSQNGVSSVTINSPGSLYIVGNTLSAAASSIGGVGTGFSVLVGSVLNSTGTSWLGDNYDPVLFYGAMREAVIFMKGEQDMVSYYEKMFQESLMQLKRLGDGLERNDAYRKGQTSLEYKGL